MKWVIEDNFENIANFLGELFNITPEKIVERFVNVPEMFVLKFLDNSGKILGTLISVKDEVAPTIVELLYIAFLPEIDFQENNAFFKLINFCKTEFIDVVYAHNFNSEGFVNIHLEKLAEKITTHKRMNLNLSLETYKQKWYDLEKKNILKSQYDFLKFNKTIKLKRGRKSYEFRIKPIHEISTDKIARLMNKVYSNSKFVDNVVLLSQKFPSYNISIMMKLLTGFYGKVSNDLSMFVETTKGELVGYVINLEPIDKNGFTADFVIDPAYQGMGLGKVLFRNTIIKYFEELKCNNISLAVTATNDAAKILYLKNGFKVVDKEFQEGILFID